MNLLFVDLDDTLLKSDPNLVHIRKKVNDGDWEELSTEDFAKDKMKGKPGVEYDLSDFFDEEKMYDSIITATPIIENLKTMDRYVSKGFKVAFLTARATEDAIRRAIKQWLKVRDELGNLKDIGGYFSDDFSAAVNDAKYSKVFGGLKDFERKAEVIKKAASQCERVVFMDDDANNLKSVRGLGLKNVKVIEAK